MTLNLWAVYPGLDTACDTRPLSDTDGPGPMDYRTQPAYDRVPQASYLWIALHAALSHHA